MIFNDLRVEEIDLRVQSETPNGIILVPYKGSDADVKILNETCGALNWTKEYKSVGNNVVCRVSIYDENKKEWVFKEDTGELPKSGSVKGLYTDAFKRACVNWGIGIELRSSPLIFIKRIPQDKVGKNGSVMTKFNCSKISYINKVIVELEITDQFGNIRFTYKNNKKPTPTLAVSLSEDDKKKYYINDVYCLKKGKYANKYFHTLKNDELKEILDSLNKNYAEGKDDTIKISIKKAIDNIENIFYTRGV